MLPYIPMTHAGFELHANDKLFGMMGTYVFLGCASAGHVEAVRVQRRKPLGRLDPVGCIGMPVQT